MSRPRDSRRARLLAAGTERGDQTALVQGVRTRTWSAMHGASDTWRRRFHALGIGPGDRVAALLPASIDAIEAMLGAYRLGAIWVPICDRYRGPEVEHIVSDCEASVLLLDPALVDRVPDTCAVPRQRMTPATPAPTELAPVQRDDDAPCLLIYTSGTTGRSKGVTLSMRALVDGITALTQGWRFSSRDVMSLMLPLFHVHGLGIGVHGALLHGVPIRLHPRFAPESVVDDVRHGATVFMGVPTMYTRLLRHLAAHPADGRVLAAARLFTAGSAALPAADLEGFAQRTGHRILERYGMTETLLTLSNPHDGERRAGSVGLPVQGVQVRVVDEAGAEVAAGVSGELQVQTPGMMSGYWGRPADTAAAFDGPWFRTGDVVVREADGYVRIVGRMSTDIIKSGGFKLGAREIEDALLTCDGLEEVAVFGASDPEWGERVVAAVVTSPEAPTDDAALLALVQQHVAGILADHKKPRDVMRVDALPRNALGKVQKVALRRTYEARLTA